MRVIRCLLLTGLVLIARAPAAVASIEFFFTNDAVLRMGIEGATREWTAQCVRGGEFADVAMAMAPDARMSAEERRARAAQFDRAEFTRIATDARQKADSALPQRSTDPAVPVPADPTDPRAERCGHPESMPSTAL